MTTLKDNGGIKLKRKIVTIIICMLLSTIILPVASSIPSKTADETDLHEVFNIQEDNNFYPQKASEFANDFIIDIIEQLDETMYLSYLEDIVDFGTRVTGTPACHDAGDYIYNEFQSMDLGVRYHDWNYGGYEDRNIEATLPGTDNTSDEIYIICAHYDTVSNCPGADDDASGVATVLAAANILSQYEFNHTIRFVTFSGEEQWMLGSHEYVMEAVENEDNIIAVLNVDMIGFALTSTHGSNIKIFKNSPSLWISDYTIDIAEEYYDYIHLNVVPLGEAPSDQLYFWENGFDAVFYHEYEFNYYYHTPNDVIENINLTYATRFSKLVLATLVSLAQRHPIVAEFELEIEGGLGLSAIFRNIGEGDAQDCEWEIIFDGGIILSPKGSTISGSFNILAPDDETKVDVLPLGFGGFITPLEIVVSIDASNAKGVEEKVTAKIFLFFVIII